jgi:hypothetical protein
MAKSGDVLHEKPLRNLLWPVLAGAAVAAWHWVRVRL